MGAGLRRVEPFPGSPHVRWMESHSSWKEKRPSVTVPSRLIVGVGDPQGGMGRHGALFSSRLLSRLALRHYCSGTCTTATMKGASHLPFY